MLYNATSLTMDRVAGQGFFALMSPIRRSEQTGRGRVLCTRAMCVVDMARSDVLVVRESRVYRVAGKSFELSWGLLRATKRMGREVSEQDE